MAVFLRNACALAVLLAAALLSPVTASVPTAELGIEVPTLGAYPRYLTDDMMLDIRDNLHARYVRTGWIPDWVYKEERHHRAWILEDRAMHEICKFGLHVMAIVPGPKYDKRGADDLEQNVTTFFTRYAQREPGCIRWAEIVNEADLQQSGFADVTQYSAFYARVAPIAASFGLPVITSGVSGEDRLWTLRLAGLLRAMTPPPPVSGYGYHPYGTPVAELAGAIAALRQDSGGHQVYVTEIGQSTPDTLYETIVALAHATPAITIYTYGAAPSQDPQYALKAHPQLYAAVQRAWADALATPRGP